MADLIRRLRVILDRAQAAKTADELIASLDKAGKNSGAEFIKSLRAQFDRRKAELAEQLARGVINEKEFKKQGDKAARAFNAGLLHIMDEARKKGEITDREYIKLTKTLKKVGDEGGKAGRSLASTFGKVAGVFAGLFALHRITAFGKSLFSTAAEADAVWNRLSGTLENVGINFGEVEKSVRANARAMQDATVVGDEQYAEVLTELISISQNYEASVRNVSVVADLAAAKQIDLKTAAQLVGKAMVGETGTLKRYGIVVQEGADAIEVMRQRFKGMAENEVRTLAGQTKQLTNEWDDFKEALGRTLADAGSGTSIISALTQSVRSMAEFVELNAETFKQWADSFLRNAVRVTDFLRITSPAKRGAASELAAIRQRTQVGGKEAVRAEHQSIARQNVLLIQQYDEMVAQTQKWGHFTSRAEKEQIANLKTRIETNDIVLRQLHDMLLLQDAPVPPGATPPPAPRTGGTPGRTRPTPREAPLPERTFGGVIGADQFATRDLMIVDQEANVEAAEQFATPWEEALAQIATEVEAQQGLFAQLGDAWAQGGLVGLAKFAIGKVKENIARAIEEGAKAIGAFALGDARGGSLHLAAAAKATAAASAWKLAGAAFGGGGGNAGAGNLGGSGNIGGAAADKAQITSETHIYLNPFDRDNPVHQSQVGIATEKYAERGGRIVLHNMYDNSTREM